jgi:hypothetical protein
VPTVAHLWVLNIDPDAAAEHYRLRVLEQLAAHSALKMQEARFKLAMDALLSTPPQPGVGSVSTFLRFGFILPQV